MNLQLLQNSGSMYGNGINNLVINLPFNAVNNETPPSAFPESKISYCEISTGNANGLPEIKVDC